MGRGVITDGIIMPRHWKFFHSWWVLMVGL